LSIEEDCFNDDIGNSSKAPTYDLKGLNFEPGGQDLEELVNNYWGFIMIPEQSAVAWKVFHSRRFAMIQEWD
jgi:hypothetical protein